MEVATKEKNANRKLSPLVGESVNRQVDERGKCEQKRKNKKISMSKTNKKYSDLYTQTCPYRLAKLGTSLRIRGKLTLRKKAIKFYKSINWSNEYIKNRIGNASCPRLREASEPLFEERSDAVKVSETLCLG